MRISEVNRCQGQKIISITLIDVYIEICLVVPSIYYVEVNPIGSDISPTVFSNGLLGQQLSLKHHLTLELEYNILSAFHNIFLTYLFIYLYMNNSFTESK